MQTLFNLPGNKTIPPPPENRRNKIKQQINKRGILESALSQRAAPEFSCNIGTSYSNTNGPKISRTCPGTSAVCFSMRFQKTHLMWTYARRARSFAATLVRTLSLLWFGFSWFGCEVIKRPLLRVELILSSDVYTD